MSKNRRRVRQAPRWRQSQKGCPERYYAVTPLRRMREILFVDELFPRLASVLDIFATLPMDKKKQLRRKLALASLKPAGYYRRSMPLKKDGNPKVLALKQVDYLLGMPRIQAALEEKFEAHGFTLDKAVAVLWEIARGRKRVRCQQLVKREKFVDGVKVESYDKVEIERDVTPGERMAAVRTRVAMTTGFAPAKSASVSATMQTDNFFDPDEYADTPPIEQSEQEEPPLKNVTPKNPRKRSRKKDAV